MQRLDWVPLSDLCIIAGMAKETTDRKNALEILTNRFLSAGITDPYSYADFINLEIENYKERREYNDFINHNCNCTEYMKYYFKYIRFNQQETSLFSELVMYRYFDIIAAKEANRLNKLIKDDQDNEYFYETFRNILSDASSLEYYDAYEYLVEFDEEYYRHPTQAFNFISDELDLLMPVFFPTYSKFNNGRGDVNYFDPELVDVFKEENKKLSRILPYYPRNK